MDYRIIWSPSSISDLKEIIEFIAKEDPETAKRAGNRIIRAVEQVTLFPQSGRIVPEFSMQGIRELILNPYRIVYRINAESCTIELARIWHAKRGIPNL